MLMYLYFVYGRMCTSLKHTHTRAHTYTQTHKHMHTFYWQGDAMTVELVTTAPSFLFDYITTN